MKPTSDVLRRLPKVVLHDHLDGGPRPGTLVELCADSGHDLPTTDADELAAWFVASATAGSLERYMATYEHTLAAMQTRDALRRVAEEYVLDLAADGVVYAETRYAPELHLARGLGPADVVEAVQDGLAAGTAKAGAAITVNALLCAMRNAERSFEIADLALAFRGAGVVGFDIAGPENGHPPSVHRAAFEHAHRAGLPVTVHAGEAFGTASIHEAVHVCGADRLGHGVRIVDDIADIRGAARLGPLAGLVRERRIALEMCPTSNLQTGAAASIAAHPITRLRELGFRVTVNTDSRLVAGTSMTREMSLLVDQAGWTVEDLRAVTVDALESAFAPDAQRAALLADVVRPGFAPFTDDLRSG